MLGFFRRGGRKSLGGFPAIALATHKLGFRFYTQPPRIWQALFFSGRILFYVERHDFSLFAWYFFAGRE